DKHRILFTEIPYQVIKQELCKSIGALADEKRIDGITGIRDESGRDGMRIVVEHRRDVNPQILLNQLYKYTQLEDTCAINMLALVNNEPKVLTLPQILDHYIEHQQSVIYRRVKFDLEKARARAHILEGYHIATDNIDRIVEIMKTSKSIPEAKQRLMSEFFTITYKDGFESDLGNVRQLTDVQAQAIVDMTLGKLTGMEREKIEQELARLHALIVELQGILEDKNKVNAIIKEEMLEIKRKFGDERRTEIIPSTEEIDIEDLIERHECVITMTHAGYIKRLPADTYSAQHRGGKGVIGMATKAEDYIEKVLGLCSHSYLLMFTNMGKIHVRKAYQIPEASRTAKGTNIVNIIEMMPGEKITVTLPCTAADEEERYICMITKKGIIKRTKLSDFKNTRKSGIIAISLDEDDELAFVRMTTGNQNLLVATHKGMAIQFNELAVRSMGRTARGVKAINMREGDFVVDMAICDENTRLLTVTENGYGRISPISCYRVQSRGGKGLTNYKVEKYGNVAAVLPVTDDEDIIMIASNGIIIRIYAGDISEFARPAKGVRVMRVAEGEKILSVAKAEHDAGEVNDAPEAADADAGAVEAETEIEEEIVEEVLEEVTDNAAE
ncbi:MAG: DNA gyrase subunit A, partial [Clostridia bacterium]|nr:DNA gyrase subunit A [Clostridia bacterium]